MDLWWQSSDLQFVPNFVSVNDSALRGLVLNNVYLRHYRVACLQKPNQHLHLAEVANPKRSCERSITTRVLSAAKT